MYTLFRLVSSGQRPSITADPVIWQIVRLLASYEDPTLKSKVAKLSRALVEWQPDFRRQLMSKKKALEQAVQGRQIFMTIFRISINYKF